MFGERDPVFLVTATGKAANLVPVDTLDKVADAVPAYTQTVAIYPDRLNETVRRGLPLDGLQCQASLGNASSSVTSTGPQGAIEPVRRMGAWILDTTRDLETVFLLWSRASCVGGLI